MITKEIALSSLRPNTQWVWRGHDYSGLEWLTSEQIKPTESEINDEIARLQAEYDSNEYQRQRAQEYPSIADQLDTLYHDGLDAWKAQIKSIKDKYPKV